MIKGLAAHVLFVHFLVVLGPLTALLVIACELAWAVQASDWPSVRAVREKSSRVMIV